MNGKDIMKNNAKEYILCSSIWYKELKLKKPEILQNRGINPYNVDKGIVLCGWRHANCMYQMVAIYGIPNYKAGESIQGFLTNLNRFIDRHEAYNIAEAANQLNDRLEHPTTNRYLFSEDLY